MRFPLAALFFVALLFIAFVGYAVVSFLLSVVSDKMTTISSTLTSSSQTEYLAMLSTVQLGFGVDMVLFFIMIIVVFVVDSLRSEPESDYHYNP